MRRCSSPAYGDWPDPSPSGIRPSRRGRAVRQDPRALRPDPPWTDGTPGTTAFGQSIHVRALERATLLCEPAGTSEVSHP